MMKSSLKLSVSETQVKEIVACFDALGVGYQSLWDEGQNGYMGVGREVEGVGAVVSALPPRIGTNRTPLQPPSGAKISPVLTPPGSVTSLTYKQPSSMNRNRILLPFTDIKHWF